MSVLVVEEDVRAKCIDYLRLRYSAKEVCLVHADVPGSQSSNGALMRGSVSCSDERYPDGGRPILKIVL